MYSTRDLIERDKRHIIHGWGYTPVVLVEGKGAIVKDLDGKEYIDCICQTAGPLGIGHSHPKVVAAIKKQVEKISHTFMGTINIPRVELAEKLSKIMPHKMTKFYFTSGGSESIETALKGAMKITKKKEVISLYLAYHGGTIACLSLGQPWHRDWLPTVPGFRQIPPPYCYRCFYGKEYPGCDFECARALEDMVRYGSYNNVAAFIVEPILGNGGHILPPSNEYFKIIRETCNKYNVLLIVDEIQTGFGRTGKMWGCDYFGFEPDIMAISKVMGGGVPAGAAVFSEDILPEGFETEVWHAFTFSGSPIVCAAASAVVDVVVEEKLPEKAEEMGRFITSRLKSMAEKHKLIGDIRGPGLFIGVELIKDRKTRERATEETVQIVGKCYQKGAIFGTDKKPGIGNVLKIKPPMNIEKEQATKALNILDAVLEEVEK